MYFVMYYDYDCVGIERKVTTQRNGRWEKKKKEIKEQNRRKMCMVNTSLSSLVRCIMRMKLTTVTVKEMNTKNLKDITNVTFYA